VRALAEHGADSHTAQMTRARTTPLGGRFTATLFKYPGAGGWTFVEVPERYAPPVTHAWGRTPVTASIGTTTWETSVWRGKDGRTLLSLPKAVRGTLGAGDRVTITLRFHGL